MSAGGCEELAIAKQEKVKRFKGQKTYWLNYRRNTDAEKCGRWGRTNAGRESKWRWERKLTRKRSPKEQEGGTPPEHRRRVAEEFEDEMCSMWLRTALTWRRLQVLRGVGGNDVGVETKAEVEGRLDPLLSGSLLLVLDDIWSANVWRELLRNPILKGSCRSVILFTTRHEVVAREMRADYVHPAEKIDEGSGWELIRKIVFGDGEDAIISELEEVGMEIVRKCDGLPLAIKVMAGVLFHKERTKTEWKKVVESDLWFRKEIKLSNALYLSYEDLPNHLKQCFLSCAFYHGISHRSDIIRLWVAEGFVIEELDSLMEVTAKDYYKELIARNLLQIDQRFEDGRLFVMHGVLRSFGEKLMEEEGIIISGDPYRNSLPDSLVKLSHLKYLNLDGTKIRKLPESIKDLANLQTLCLSGCKSLHELPDGITRLSNLRCLRILSTPLTHFPKGFGKLKNLNNLAGFFVGHRDSMSMMEGGCDLDELQYLCNLNDLVISKLERARTTNFVLENKTFLRILTLGWTMNNNENNDEQSSEAERICKQLSPPATLEGLSIDNFPGRQFPDWMVSTSLADLTFLALDKFPSCRENK
ncbi:putative disease resistance RPP13-like protein 1 [Zingiber officinale]|uniref:putative disease resistance RPP13-like protein 1 n=1 Tax=Zingiber officinale TaxID=94328 RepID=UPI001C4B38E7|nr:putative disease resistance RPP13-like protein 1 [Zingiber officinale]